VTKAVLDAELRLRARSEVVWVVHRASWWTVKRWASEEVADVYRRTTALLGHKQPLAHRFGARDQILDFRQLPPRQLLKPLGGGALWSTPPTSTCRCFRRRRISCISIVLSVVAIGSSGR
jgi:hypothetical protein